MDLFDLSHGKNSFVTIGVFVTEFCSTYHGKQLRRDSALPDSAEGLYVVPDERGYSFVTVRDGVRRQQSITGRLIYRPNAYARAVAKRLGLPRPG